MKLLQTIVSLFWFFYAGNPSSSVADLHIPHLFVGLHRQLSARVAALVQLRRVSGHYRSWRAKDTSGWNTPGVMEELCGRNFYCKSHKNIYFFKVDAVKSINQNGMNGLWHLYSSLLKFVYPASVVIISYFITMCHGTCC